MTQHTADQPPSHATNQHRPRKVTRRHRDSSEEDVQSEVCQERNRGGQTQKLLTAQTAKKPVAKFYAHEKQLQITALQQN